MKRSTVPLNVVAREYFSLPEGHIDLDRTARSEKIVQRAMDAGAPQTIIAILIVDRDCSCVGTTHEDEPIRSLDTPTFPLMDPSLFICVQTHQEVRLEQAARELVAHFMDLGLDWSLSPLNAKPLWALHVHWVGAGKFHAGINSQGRLQREVWDVLTIKAVRIEDGAPIWRKRVMHALAGGSTKAILCRLWRGADYKESDITSDEWHFAPISSSKDTQWVVSPHLGSLIEWLERNELTWKLIKCDSVSAYLEAVIPFY